MSAAAAAGDEGQSSVSIDLEPMEALALLMSIASLDGQHAAVTEGPADGAARRGRQRRRRQRRARGDQPARGATAPDAAMDGEDMPGEECVDPGQRRRRSGVNLSLLVRSRARRIDWSDPRSIERGEARLVRTFERRLAEGAVQDVDARDRREGLTALHRSVTLGLWRLASLLVAHGADAAAQDERGVSPLVLAACISSDNPRALALVRDMAAATHSAGLRSPTAATASDPPAAHAGAKEPAPCLVDTGSPQGHGDDDASDAAGSTWPSIETLSQIASSAMDAPAAMALLLDGVGAGGRARGPATHGAGVHAAHVLGPWGEARWTLLHKAARHGNVGVALVLLGRGADPNATTVDGVTPLHIAALCGYAQTAMVLLAHGADPALLTGDIVTEGNDPSWSHSTAGTLARVCGSPALADAIDAWIVHDPLAVRPLPGTRGETRDTTDSEEEGQIAPHEDALPDSP
jgi:hypothetical protein